MLLETVATGKDVNAAIDEGCAQLGISREEAEFEIISLPRKGFLGLKTYPAKVRVYKEIPDPKPAPAKPRRENPEGEKTEQKPRRERPEGEKTEQKPRRERPEGEKAEQKPRRERPEGEKAEQKPRRERPEGEKAEQKPRRERPEGEKAEQKPRRERPENEKAEQKPRRERPESEKAEQKPREAASVQQLRELVEIVPTDLVRTKVERSAAYVTEILTAMGFEDVKVQPKYYTDCVCLQLTGSGLGVIIGRRGETLDSLQYLASLVANRGEGDYIRVNIDSGNYRQKREKTLIALAKKLANNAVRTGRSTTLEPMNPYERRVIHGAVSQVKGATSASIGVDPNRRVVISPVEGAKAAPAGRGGKSRSDRDGRKGGRDRRRSDRPRSDRGPRHESGNEIKTRPQNYPPAPIHDVSRDMEGLEDIPRGVPILPGTPAPKAEKPAPAPTPKVERSEEEVEATRKASLYGKIEL